MKDKKYQIFLSSTYLDLTDERESIIKAVLELYHIPIGMEMFSAEDEDQWEVIRRTIEVSDYYILVLGLRYGSKTSDGVSFTQKEYEYALSRKIPILAFVMDDSVSLSKERRDDDLSDIRTFRNSVLQNSKMAQFWKTKDELIKNVSISLMKQIMQKPGIGWIRGDGIVAEAALSAELTKLSVENRELRERVKELESKISQKRPDVRISIAALSVDKNFEAFKKILMPAELRLREVMPHLLDYISEEDIASYNRDLPSQYVLDKFNDEMERYHRITNYSMPLIVNIENLGSSKANNLFVDIEFPEGLFLYENNARFDRPHSPLPKNPLIAAEKEYQKVELQKKRRLLGTSIGFPHLGYDPSIHLNTVASMHNRHFSVPNLHPNWSTKIDGHKLTIRVNSLLHTRLMTFDDEYSVVPLAEGAHSVRANIICEEYEAIETQYIELTV